MTPATSVVDAQGRLKKTKKRVLTQRGVIWLGQTCNLRCYFCYFRNRVADGAHPEHPFMSLDKAKEICRTLRYVYGNTSVDLQGGEPTIYPHILELVGYCRDIGLHATLITNGIVLAKPGTLEQFRDAGVRDFLVSLHGIGDMHDEVVGRKGAFEKIIAAIERMRELDMPFRFNCTMTKAVVPHLTAIAQKAIEHGASVVNYIAFNDFEDQDSGQDVRTTDNVARYSAIKPQLTEAIDMLEEAGVETNVRYLPLCMAEPRHRKNFYNLQQLSYDLHEWDFQSWMWTGNQPQRMRDSELMPPYLLGCRARHIYSLSQELHHDFAANKPLKRRVKFALQRGCSRFQQIIKGKDALYRQEAIERAERDFRNQHYQACECCSLRRICDGFHEDYAELFGTEEAFSVSDLPVIDDPLYFIREQEKYIEKEEWPWAL